MDPEEKIEVAKLLLEKAEEHLRTARLALKEGLFRDAISRAYYSAYSSALAVLILMGHEPKKHEGVISMVGLYLVRRGLLSTREGRILVRLHEMRETSDYEPVFLYEREDAEQAVSSAAEFLRRMTELVKELEADLRDRYSGGRNE